MWSSVEEALAFLENYPKGRESPIYQRAVNSCFAASAGEDSADNTRKAFVTFSRMVGLLAKDSACPAWSDRPDHYLKPLVSVWNWTNATKGLTNSHRGGLGHTRSLISRIGEHLSDKGEWSPRGVQDRAGAVAILDAGGIG
jgi:hypothetical protein